MFKVIKIPLTQGKVALINEEDMPLVNQFKWHARKDGCRFYAHTNIKTHDGKRIYLSMHRLIMNPTKDIQVDHINGNGLDNRRNNLRNATCAQNLFNQRRKQYKGICFHQGKWQAQIQFNKKQFYLGRFNNEKDAAKAYDRKAQELFGDYACLNFSERF